MGLLQPVDADWQGRVAFDQQVLLPLPPRIAFVTFAGLDPAEHCAWFDGERRLEWSGPLAVGVERRREFGGLSLRERVLVCDPGQRLVMGGLELSSPHVRALHDEAHFFADRGGTRLHWQLCWESSLSGLFLRALVEHRISTLLHNSLANLLRRSLEKAESLPPDLEA
jgi:hypothetical protein